MELKFADAQAKFDEAKAINRTIVELKFQLANGFFVPDPGYQSYHSGIEISKKVVREMMHGLSIVP